MAVELLKETVEPVYWFRSIPYAEAPVRHLRFEPPIPKKRWEGILDVSEESPECLQRFNTTRGEEDCLYLKIYTTKLPKDVENKLPVMVYIHGGAFIFGSPDLTNNCHYLLDQNVILVALQYRVGVFGFLSTGDMVLPGNNGLKDLVMALKWVKNNIEAFGGDPNRITIHGQSAGSALVSYLLQTNHTKGLFSGAIMQSGSSLCLWSYFRKAMEFTTKFAKTLKLNDKSLFFLDEIKYLDANLLLNAQSTILLDTLKESNPRDGILLGPVIEPEHEGAIFSSKSYEQLKKGYFHHIPILMGHTSLEGYLNEIPGILRYYLGGYDIFLSKLVPVDMHVTCLLESHFIGGAIKDKYFGNKLIAFSTKEVMEFVSDDQFERPIQESVHLYSASSPVFYYKFSYKGQLSGVTNRIVEGVGHSEDLSYLFDSKYQGTDDDYLTRSRMVKLWTNFVKTGNPTPERDPLLQMVTWPSNRGSDNVQCLVIDKNLEVMQNVEMEKMRFWKNLYDKYGSNFDTY